MCTGDSDCSSGYFCGSAVPDPDKNFFDNSAGSIPGEILFLQRDVMGLDGNSVISVPSTSHPPLMTDLTIFATVCQDPGNNGYVVGKGINDQIRDFGLYLRSSRETVWLAYGATDDVDGFRHILFFYNVSVADGSCHSVAATIDSFSNRAVLYVDGEAVGIRSPLPGVPNFRPYVSITWLFSKAMTIKSGWVQICTSILSPFNISTVCLLWAHPPLLPHSPSPT